MKHKYEHLLVEDKGKGITLVTINRPGAANATNESLHKDLANIWLDLDKDPTVKGRNNVFQCISIFCADIKMNATVIIITGAGDAFCAGTLGTSVLA